MRSAASLQESHESLRVVVEEAEKTGDEKKIGEAKKQVRNFEDLKNLAIGESGIKRDLLKQLLDFNEILVDIVREMEREITEQEREAKERDEKYEKLKQLRDEERDEYNATIRRLSDAIMKLAETMPPGVAVDTLKSAALSAMPDGKE